jgi:3',5'-nucleoside bisphosphate phosphatase
MGTSRVKSDSLLAVKEGLKAIAITDHDTVKGIPEARDEAESHGLEIVSGVELSAMCKSGTLHILGFCVRFQNPYFRRCLDDLRQGRQHLVKDRLARLQELGMTEFPANVSREADWRILEPGLLGDSRKSLMVTGDLRNAPYACPVPVHSVYRPRANLLPGDAVKLIAAAGGIPVVAHPYSIIKHSSLNWNDVLERLLPVGIQGIEVYHPTHAVAQTLIFLETARKNGLLVTGGSDFHCEAKPDLRIGRVPGWSPLSYEMVQALKDHVAKREGISIS